VRAAWEGGWEWSGNEDETGLYLLRNDADSGSIAVATDRHDLGALQDIRGKHLLATLHLCFPAGEQLQDGLVHNCVWWQIVLVPCSTLIDGA